MNEALHPCCGAPSGGDHEPYCDVGVYQTPAGVDRLFYEQRVVERDEARANLAKAEEDLRFFARLVRQHYGDVLLARQERDELRSRLEKEQG